VATTRSDILVTEIAPALLELFDLEPRDWHRDYAGRLLRM
jgi:hypothetical protein